MLELVIGILVGYDVLLNRFGIIGMIICIIMQYLRTGILSVQSLAENNSSWHVWAIPPIVMLIGLIIGIVCVD